MRSLLAASLLVFSACSGLPPESLVPLEYGETATGVNVAIDLQSPKRPDVSAWIGYGLGKGVDLALGVDAPVELMIGGLGAFGLLAEGVPPGFAVRKTFANGVGVGVGTASRLSFAIADSSASPFMLVTAGPFVTVATSNDGPALGRATAYVGYAGAGPLRGDTAPLRGLAIHGSGQLGAIVAEADTAFTAVAARAQAGTFLLPWLHPLHGPTVGFTTHVIDH